MADNVTNRNGDQPMIDLWIKAGCDGLRASGCPVGQQFFMLLLMKAEKTDDVGLQFNVKTTHLHKPHDEFRSSGMRRLPALVSGSDVRLEHLDDILEYLDTYYPCPSGYQNYRETAAYTACKDLFSKFCFFIKDVNRDSKFLEAELRKFDAFLTESKTKFLCSNELSYLDCEMLPKLHHVRLACARLKKYHIPSSLTSLWSYMERGYKNPIFQKSCPCDQEIILHWADRPDTLNLSSIDHKDLCNQPPTFTFDVPSSVN
uniref:CLIC N-terminal domain-containing protein n=1 Tax=Romanomermis culicivorax TaxID=13658 RepID=A0A915I3T3_ROMCU